MVRLFLLSMILTELFGKLAAKAGLNPTDPRFAPILSLPPTDIPEEISSKFLSSLLSTEEAKNNGELKAYFKAQVYDGVDSQLKTLMTEYNLDAESISELVAEKNTYERVNKLVKKVQTLEGKKAGATGTEKTELQRQINELNDTKAQLIKSHETEKKNLQAEFEGKLSTMTIRSLLGGRKYPTKDLPQEVNVETAWALLNKFAQEKGARIVNTNGTLTVKQLKDEALDWYTATGEKPNLEQFIDMAMAESKFVAVNDAGSNNPLPGGQGSGNNPTPPFINGNGVGNQGVLNANDANLQALEAALK